MTEGEEVVQFSRIQGSTRDYNSFLVRWGSGARESTLQGHQLPCMLSTAGLW
jgi:hypothetical protein